MKPTVLLIDDSECIHELLRPVFCEDWTLRSAFSGQQGLAMAKDPVPDLIILDLDLPDINGFDVCRHLRAESVQTNLAILFLSSSATTSEKVCGLEIGGSDFVCKPFAIAELKLRARNLIRNKRLLDELPSAMRWCSPVRSGAKARGKSRQASNNFDFRVRRPSQVPSHSNYSGRAA